MGILYSDIVLRYRSFRSLLFSLFPLLSAANSPPPLPHPPANPFSFFFFQLDSRWENLKRCAAPRTYYTHGRKTGAITLSTSRRRRHTEKTLQRTATLGGENGASANQTNAGSVLKGDLWETSEARDESAGAFAKECYTYRDVAKSAILTQTSPRVLYKECYILTETSPRVLYLQRRRQECYTYRDVAKSAI